jgi:hypothetical protein
MKKLQILGTGCPNCKKLAENTEVTDINEIMNFGVMMTPALAVDGQVKVIGKVLSPDKIKKILV